MSRKRQVTTCGWAIVLLTVVMVPVAAVGTAQAQSSVTVHLIVETNAGASQNLDPGQTSALPGTAECDVQVPEGADGGVVLDQAVADLCILEWDYQNYDCCGRFVTSIDGLRADGFTCLLWAEDVADVCDWWEHHVNGTAVSYGIDGYSAQDGDTVRWEYRNTPPES